MIDDQREIDGAPPETGPAPARRRITVSSPSLYRRQLVHFGLFNVAAAIGAVAAIAWSLAFGFRWTDLALLVGFYFLTLFGVEVGFHRCFAHRAFSCRAGVQRALAALGCAAAQGPISHWVATHRRHHAFSERDEDPHSPTRGFWHAHMGWLLDREATFTPRFAADVMVNPAVRWAERRYYLWVALGLLLPGAIGGLAGGSLEAAVSGFLWGGPLRLFLAQQGSFSINSACHTFGEQPFPTRDRSRNLKLMSIVSLGQSLHNNHHAFPRSATTALHRGELDIGGWLIRAMARCGAASDLVVPDAEAVGRKKQAVPAGSRDGQDVSPTDAGDR